MAAFHEIFPTKLIYGFTFDLILGCLLVVFKKLLKSGLQVERFLEGTEHVHIKFLLRN